MDLGAIDKKIKPKRRSKQENVTTWEDFRTPEKVQQAPARHRRPPLASVANTLAKNYQDQEKRKRKRSPSGVFENKISKHPRPTPKQEQHYESKQGGHKLKHERFRPKYEEYKLKYEELKNRKEKYKEKREECGDYNPLAAAVLRSVSARLENPEEAYTSEIMAYSKELEQRHQITSTEKLFRGPIKPHMRSILMDWLIQVQVYMKLEDRTLQTACQLVDRVLSTRLVMPKYLQLLGITCLWLGAKLADCKQPKATSMLRCTDNLYTRSEMCEYEKFIILSLGFELAMSETCLFLENYLHQLEQEHLRHLCMYAVDITLPTLLSAITLPSITAAAAIYTGSLIHHTADDLFRNLLKHSEYSEEQILPTAKFMLEELSTVNKSAYQGAYLKYKSSRYNALSTSPELDPARLKSILLNRY